MHNTTSLKIKIILISTSHKQISSHVPKRRSSKILQLSKNLIVWMPWRKKTLLQTMWQLLMLRCKLPPSTNLGLQIQRRPIPVEHSSYRGMQGGVRNTTEEWWEAQVSPCGTLMPTWQGLGAALDSAKLKSDSKNWDKLKNKSKMRYLGRASISKTLKQ